MAEKQGSRSKLRVKRTTDIWGDEQYITERLQNQMEWFDRKSSWHQERYKTLKNWEFVVGASIPVLVTFSTSSLVDFTVWATIKMSDVLQVLSAIGGVILVILTKQIDLEDHFRHWKDYRANAEQLQHELMLYKTCTEPYHEADAFHRLVRNVEDLLNQENMKWMQHGYEKQQGEEDDED